MKPGRTIGGRFLKAQKCKTSTAGRKETGAGNKKRTKQRKGKSGNVTVAQGFGGDGWDCKRSGVGMIGE